jgi:hypothetical protein
MPIILISVGISAALAGPFSGCQPRGRLSRPQRPVRDLEEEMLRGLRARIDSSIARSALEQTRHCCGAACGCPIKTGKQSRSMNCIGEKTSKMNTSVIMAEATEPIPCRTFRQLGGIERQREPNCFFFREVARSKRLEEE